MANVNVNRKVTDQFYRYKMPKLIAKVSCTVCTVVLSLSDMRLLMSFLTVLTVNILSVIVLCLSFGHSFEVPSPVLLPG